MQTNHVCEYYEDTSVCSTATQIAVQGAVIDPVTLRPWEGERFLLVGLKRSAAQVQKKMKMKIKNTKKIVARCILLCVLCFLLC